MNVWTKDYPKEPGHYWVKRAFNGNKEIVFVSKLDLVLQIGAREPLSSHYDIYEWGSRLEEPGE